MSIENPFQNEESPITPEESTENEKNRIYERPEDDPVIKELEVEITKKTNEDPRVRRQAMSGKRDEDEMLWYRVNSAVAMHAYNRFVYAYPEKAVAYADLDSQIKKALDRQKRPE